MIENVTLLAAFGAGLLSFISPCVLPLIPGYLSYISGLSLDELRGTDTVAVSAATRNRVVLSSLAFILGFSLVFVALGASASALGRVLMSELTLLGKVAGVIIVLFGLHTMGLLRIDWLYQEKRIQTNRQPAGLMGAMLVGHSTGGGEVAHYIGRHGEARVAKADVKERRETETSLMPANFAEALTPAELNDLLAFLLGKSGK
mgnify:CR=1 FL=1